CWRSDPIRGWSSIRPGSARRIPSSRMPSPGASATCRWRRSSVCSASSIRKHPDSRSSGRSELTPSARLAAVIEILDEIASRPGPADAIFANYVRARRFIGSKDRADIAERVFGIFRRRARLAWWLERHGAPLTARLLVLADLLVVQGIGPDRLRALFGGGRYEPAPLRPEEAALGGALAGKPLEHEEMPERVRLECPAWAEQALRSSLAASFATELRALQAAAAVDLRVNVLRASRDEARSALARDGIVTVPTGLSPW